MLCAATITSLNSQPAVVKVKAPCKVFGDIHGQLRDLLLLFSKYGFPHHRDGDVDLTSYIFNGDWVDRGPHQLETVIFLFAIKVLYPTKIWLVRGNHEFRVQNISMDKAGFHIACEALFPYSTLFPYEEDYIFELIHDTFDVLPIAAIIQDKILVIHGGIGDGKWTLEDLEQNYKRPRQDFFEDTTIFNILWSDPIPEEGIEKFEGGVHLNPRDGHKGDIKSFGKLVTSEWCEKNKISIIIRSHEYASAGFKIMHGGQLITVFSARDYDNARVNNDSALLLIFLDDNNDLRIRAKTLASATQNLIGDSIDL